MIGFILNIILTFVLLVGTAGISINKHFCGNYLASCSIFSEEENCCDNNCNNCYNTTETFKIDDVFIAKTFQSQSVQKPVYKIHFNTSIELPNQMNFYLINRRILPHKLDNCKMAFISTDADKLQVFRL